MSGFNLSAWAIRHQTLVLFFIFVTAAAGIFAYSNLGRNEDPAFTVKVMVVTAVWPGASAAEEVRPPATLPTAWTGRRTTSPSGRWR